LHKQYLYALHLPLSVMYRYAVIMLLLLIHYGAGAQVMEGLVMDIDSKTPITGVRIYNKHSGVLITSDKDGHYSIAAASGDTLQFMHIAYLPYEEVMTYVIGTKYKTILMLAHAYSLKEMKLTGYTKYQQDSIEKHTEYSHELNKTLVPPAHFTGLGCAGCVGALADLITGNSKKPKAFRQHFAEDDKSQFIDSRYTFALVTTLTHLSDTDSIAAFIYAYPMQYEFARTATDLELKMWIRNNFKEYKQLAFVKKRDGEEGK